MQKQNKKEDPRFIRFQTILKNLRIIFRSTQAHSRWVEKESGLSAAQLWMLWELFNEPGLTVSGLATVLSIHRSTCSNMLDKLQDKELVYRERSHNDQRVVQLYLTKKGTELLAKAPRPAQGTLADVLLRLPDDALLELEQGLDKFVAALKIVDTDDGMLPITEKS
ncbi:MAG: MarR family transcriptional regulator [Desulfobulbaceae bacterium]|nr:MarR family transcriptional regulator [Desulfobulbaceae bacterium]MCK5436652.1 MarR family transcriptional regulator [Desulfobulbaceae bacterium]MCK5544603.1 MarR family transcriptional regulator [Desulfobulbaceae bacterium]